MFCFVLSTHWCQFEIGQDVIKIMEFRELQQDHLILEFQHAAHDPVQDMVEHPPLLRMDDLIVALLEAAEDLDVFDVEGGDVLEGGESILFGLDRFSWYLLGQEVCEALLGLGPLALIIPMKINKI